MRTLIEDSTVLTMDGANRVLEHGWIDIRDGEIVEVSPRPIDPLDVDERIDGSGCVVLPGLVNAHTHLFQTLIRGLYREIPFADWLRAIYRCGAFLTPDDCSIGARLGCLEAVRSGVTTVIEHAFLDRDLELSRATIGGMRAAGVRTVFARTIIDLGELAPPAVVETPAQGLRSVERLLALYEGEAAGGMLTLMTGANTPGASSSGELAKAVSEFAEQHGLGQSTHLAESATVLQTVRERYGQPGVVAWLDSLGALAPKTIAAHSVFVSREEIEVMARQGMSVAHNPVSNMFLGDGIAPVAEMLAAGVNVALGTDGAASNNSQDMFEVLKVATLLQRARLRDPHAITPMQGLRMATINGARAAGLDRLVGSIEPGKRADLVMVELGTAPHNVAVHDVPSHLVYCAKASDVRHVIIDGVLVMRDRLMTVVDEPRLLAEAQVAGPRLAKRLAA